MTPQTWIIVGGAGYIGSHIADRFLTSGKKVVIFDSLYRGQKSRVDFLSAKHQQQIPLVVADIRDTSKFDQTLAEFTPIGVVHTAALKAVSESIEKPDEYFEVNWRVTAAMLEILLDRGVHNFIFSSTAALYGSPEHSNPIKEDSPKQPISPYGESKLAAENEVNKFLSIRGNFGASLRFFNVVGTQSPELQDNSIENLVPIVMNNLKLGQPPKIFGTDYPTPDGTCIRDYVDVRDVARAHLLAADAHFKLPMAINIGTGRGTSVRTVINQVCAAAEKSEVVAMELERRAGDPAALFADVSLAAQTLGFTAEYSLEESIKGLFSK